MAKKNDADTAAKKKKTFLRKPQYEGGAKALRDYITRELRYPADAVAAHIHGDVQIRYDVNDDGEVIDAKVLRGIGGGCNEEALRLVRSLRFVPVRNRGIRTTSHFDIVIHFRLPPPVPAVQHPAPPPVALAYTYVPAQPAQQIPAQVTAQDTGRQQQTSYTWSISIPPQRKKNNE
ncbi:MAG: energy transducer TonB [Candidatus Kapabacteria bacterium]|nr:energy transducer TonB [Candidatus Kapabacteria bacterium]